MNSRRISARAARGGALVALAAAACGSGAAPGPQPLPAGAEVRRDPHTEVVLHLAGGNLSAALEPEPTFARLQAERRFGELAVAFLTAYRGAFRLQDPAAELAVRSVVRDELGFTHVKLAQRYRGLPVWGCELIVHLDAGAHVVRVAGRTVPTPSGVDLEPRIDRAAALRIVGDALAAPGGCGSCPSELMLVPRAGSEMRLAHRVHAAPSLTQAWDFLVDAHSGEILERIGAVYDALGPGTTRVR